MQTAMILAAGSGQRMQELGKTIPKTLLTVKEKPLIAYHLDRIKRAGITKVVINLAHLGEQIKSFVGNGENFGLEVMYSQEEPGGLETGGGIFNALPILGVAPFLVINGDIWTDFELDLLPNPISGLAHLVLVENPAHHPVGDFSLLNNGLVDNKPLFTFSGIGVYHPQLFASCKPGKFRLRPVLEAAMAESTVTGQIYSGRWFDIGTPERLELVRSVVG